MDVPAPHDTKKDLAWNDAAGHRCALGGRRWWEACRIVVSSRNKAGEQWAKGKDGSGWERSVGEGRRGRDVQGFSLMEGE